MKRIISIILILVTALYVLPVASAFVAETETTAKYVDTNVDDNKDCKNDNSKEFLPTNIKVDPFQNNRTATAILTISSVLPVHFTIEMPPPDKA